VTTVDNQKVTIDENFNYTIPEDKVYHIMYEIGRAGNVDLESQVVPVVKDRTARILAGQNMVTINANRPAIQADIEKYVFQSVEELFGIQPHSLQIQGIIPSASFMASNEAAVKAKNDAVAAENTKRIRQSKQPEAAHSRSCWKRRLIKPGRYLREKGWRRGLPRKSSRLAHPTNISNT
jgi:regulator of protease activity HflC (stomatin/prohibitin superfamily)